MNDTRLTAGEAAKYLGMTYRQFWRIFNQIPYQRTAKGWRYYWVSDLIRWKDETRKPQTPEPPKAKHVAKRKGLISLADCPRWPSTQIETT